jgi:hypothetical protein
LTPITLTAVEYVCLNMREIDRAEVFGMRAHDDALILAREIVAVAPYGKVGVAAHEGRPAAIVGVTPLWPGVWSAWAFGTDEWDRVAIELTRYALRVLRPFILERGAHRMQCESRIDHVEAHRWLELLGARPESILRRYGRDGSDYVQFAWTV